MPEWQKEEQCVCVDKWKCGRGGEKEHTRRQSVHRGVTSESRSRAHRTKGKRVRKWETGQRHKHQHQPTLNKEVPRREDFS